MTHVGTKIVLDLVTDDPVWAAWSIEQLELASVSGSLYINDVVYAELSVRYERIEALDAFVDQAGLKFTLSLARRYFWRVRPLPDIDAAAVLVPVFRLTFSLEPTRQYKTFPC